MICVVNIPLEVMRSATPHSGVEPCVGPKTIEWVSRASKGMPSRVHTRGWTAVEGVNVHQVGKAKASEPPRAIHANGPADAGL